MYNCNLHIMCNEYKKLIDIFTPYGEIAASHLCQLFKLLFVSVIEYSSITGTTLVFEFFLPHEPKSFFFIIVLFHQFSSSMYIYLVYIYALNGQSSS